MSCLTLQKETLANSTPKKTRYICWLSVVHLPPPRTPVTLPLNFGNWAAPDLRSEDHLYAFIALHCIGAKSFALLSRFCTKNHKIAQQAWKRAQRRVRAFFSTINMGLHVIFLETYLGKMHFLTPVFIGPRNKSQLSTIWISKVCFFVKRSSPDQWQGHPRFPPETTETALSKTKPNGQ